MKTVSNKKVCLQLLAAGAVSATYQILYPEVMRMLYHRPRIFTVGNPQNTAATKLRTLEYDFSRGRQSAFMPSWYLTINDSTKIRANFGYILQKFEIVQEEQKEAASKADLSNAKPRSVGGGNKKDLLVQGDGNNDTDNNDLYQDDEDDENDDDAERDENKESEEHIHA